MSPEISAPKAVRRAVESRHVINMAETEKRQAIIAARRRMNALDIDQGASGQFSVRHGKPIKPASGSDNAMTAEKAVFLAMDSTFGQGQRPASESGFHRDILRSRAVNPVLHAYDGGRRRRRQLLRAYATLRTWNLLVDVVKAVEGRFACPARPSRHDCAWPSLEKALWLAPSNEIERVRQKMAGCGQVTETRTYRTDRCLHG